MLRVFDPRAQLTPVQVSPYEALVLPKHLATALRKQGNQTLLSSQGLKRRIPLTSVAAHRTQLASQLFGSATCELNFVNNESLVPDSKNKDIYHVTAIHFIFRNCF